MLLLTSCLHAQSNWQPGYILKNGQKTEGEIDDREWPYFIDDFRFRLSPAGDVTTYSPSDRVSFGVGERRYVGREVSYITNSRELDKISNDTVLRRESALVFLRQYYEGEMGLYQFVDRLDKRHFYLQRSGGPLEYLEYELRLRDNPYNKVVRYLENYKYQLSQSLSDCPDLSIQVTEAAYKLKDLSRVVGAWYDCRGAKPEYAAKVNQGRLSVGGLAAYLRTTALGEELERGEISHEAHSGPALGVGIRYVFPGAREKFSLKLEALYHSFESVARLRTRASGFSSSIIRREFSASAIQVHLLAEYLIVTGRTSLYAEVGVAASYLLKTDQSQMQISVAADGTETNFTENINTRVNTTNELGGLLGLGLRRGPFQLGVRASRVVRFRGNSGIGFIRAGILAGYWF